MNMSFEEFSYDYCVIEDDIRNRVREILEESQLQTVSPEVLEHIESTSV